MIRALHRFGAGWQAVFCSLRALVLHKARDIPLLMESRLDLAVQQCFVFKTITSAHHWISQGKITVNLRIIKSPSHLLKPGDCIAISQPHKMEYKTQLRTLFNHLPRERKYVQSGNLMLRWNRWATLYNNLRSKHKLCHTPNHGTHERCRMIQVLSKC